MFLNLEISSCIFSFWVIWALFSIVLYIQKNNIFSLAFIAPFIYSLGAFLAPTYLYFVNDSTLHDIMVSDKFVCESLNYLLVCTILFWSGYIIKQSKETQTDIIEDRKIKRDASLIKNTQIIFVINIIAVFAFLLCFKYSTIKEYGFRYAVYENQFNPSPVEHQIRLFVSYVFIFSWPAAGFFQAKIKKWYGYYSIWPLMILIPGMIVRISLFSRGMFFAILIYWGSFLLSVERKPKYWLSLSVAVLLCFFSGMGLATLLRKEEVSTVFELNLFIEEVIKSVSINKTLCWSFMYGNNFSLYEGLLDCLRQINPLPSAIIRDLPEASLAEFVGLSGVSGVPMPTLGEIYIRLGKVGVFLSFLFGLWCRKIDYSLFVIKNKSIYWKIMYLATFIGIIVSCHSTIRASSRYVILSFALFAIIKFFEKMNIKRLL